MSHIVGRGEPISILKRPTLPFWVLTLTPLLKRFFFLKSWGHPLTELHEKQGRWRSKEGGEAREKACCMQKNFWVNFLNYVFKHTFSLIQTINEMFSGGRGGKMS